MKFIRFAFDKLKELDYFNENVNIIFSHAEKEHRREFEKFICCDANYKRFLKNYLELKDKVKKDNKLAKSVLAMYKDLLYNERGTTVSLESMYYIAPMITYLFMNSVGKLKVGNLTIDNSFTRCIEILFNEKYSMAETVSKISKTFGVKQTPKSTVKGVYLPNMIDFDLYYLQTYMYLYSFYLIQTKLYTSSNTMNTFENGIRNVHNSYIDLNFQVMEIIELFKQTKLSEREFCNQYGIDRLPTPSQMIKCSRLEIDEIRETGQFKEINRLGYLKEEYCTGELTVSEAGIEHSFKFDYDIREVVSSDGIEIIYTIQNSDFIVSVIEDYTRGHMFSNIVFYDFSNADNNDETIMGALLLFYNRLRDEYINRVNNKEMVTKEIAYDDVWNTTYEQRPDGDYVKKPIFIAPYRRKLPKGKVSAEKKQEALKFNILLEDNETFVNSFIRKQRYLKEKGGDLPNNVDDLRMGIDLQEIEV